jgi:hypothetical protein
LWRARKRVILFPGFEKGRHGVHQAGVVHRPFQRAEQLVKRARRKIGGAQGRAYGGKAVAVLGEHGVLTVQL